MSAPEGLVDGMPFPEYLTTEALSASSARKLLPPSCPALFRQEQIDQYTSTEMSVGKIAHAAILEGVDAESLMAEVPGDWRGKEARARKEEAEQAGLIPLHTKDAEAVRGMVAGVRRNTLAAALLDPAHGQAEVSMFWQDPRTGINRKGRLDFLPERRKSGRLVVPDFKTAPSADAFEFGTSAVKYGYMQQLAAYETAMKVLGIDDDPLLLLIVQETRAPYLVNVLQIPEDAMAIARDLNDWACRIYAQCIETGEWPGYGNEVQQVHIPGWWMSKYEEIAA